MDEFFKQIHFPYENLRKGQDEFIKQVYQTIYNSKNLLVSAPTGLGKTISGLAPALKIAKEKNLSVICLTSRQTQTNQIIKTIVDIQKTSKEKINYVALVGKRSMCVHKDRDLYPPQDFLDFCRKVRKTKKCNYYLNAHNEEYSEIRSKLIEDISKDFIGVEGFVQRASSPQVTPENERICGFCPYELAAEKAHKADVLICDYNYLFQEGMRESFLGKLGRPLNECIVIVDEAHNLPDRIRNAHSYSLNTETIDFALKELKDFVKESKYDAYVNTLKQAYQECYVAKLDRDLDEYEISKEELIKSYLLKCGGKSLEAVIEQLREAEILVKEDRLMSYVGRIANFLEKWDELNEIGYLRVLEKVQKNNKVSFMMKIKCLDPAEMASEVINKSQSSILMSGTLSPIKMYVDILGIENSSTLELDSPFDKDKLLPLHVDDVTTKYLLRGEGMYKRYAKHIEEILNSASDKNAIIFFPSYDLLDKIFRYVNVTSLQRRVLREMRFMTKEQKEGFVDEFKHKDPFNNKAKVLFAVTSGSFAEGLDLPGDALEMVLVVGLPLAKPDLYTESVIKLYDKKFRKGQFYGYICPAMNKIIQAAGRCIRTEEDRGVVVFMDNRFTFAIYAQTFPLHWHLKKPQDLKLTIMNFFDR